MTIDYPGKVTTIVGYFTSANTTTASPDLSSGMTTRVKSVVADEMSIQGVRGDLSPKLFVSINRASEEETQIGEFTNRKKEKLVTYDVEGVYRKSGFSQTHADHLPDFYRFAQNVEQVIKTNISFDADIIHVSVVDTEFKAEQPDNTQFKVFRIGLEVRYFYS